MNRKIIISCLFGLAIASTILLVLSSGALRYVEVYEVDFEEGRSFRVLRERFTTEPSYGGVFEVYESGALVARNESLILHGEETNFDVKSFKDRGVYVVFDNNPPSIRHVFVLDFEKKVFFIYAHAGPSLAERYQDLVGAL